MAQVTLSRITKRYPGSETAAVDDVSLTIPKGSFTTLLGPSGCGKSSTLRIVAGLSRPDYGVLQMDGRDITHLSAARRNIGMVFQSLALFPHMTVAENVAFGLEMRGIGRSERETKVARALDIVELGHLAARHPHQLSGGQQQRVALARALVVEPSILILDEPFSALDRKLRETCLFLLSRLPLDPGFTAMFVTHDQEEALTLSDSIVVMNQGRIEQQGTPREIYGAPRTRFTAEFMGLSNFLPARCNNRALSFEGLTTEMPAAFEAEGNCTVALRPEGLSLSSTRPEGAALKGHLAEAIYQGASTSYTLDLPSGRRITARTTDCGLLPGQEAWIAWTPEALHAFAA
ncbi:ABC transporter ATP-binding protein [Salipiger sp. HF18]|uniref:ABC transporter ATP-binding protein n=1 Tax=Salipiger sp. HF18 TaxID=2721557 RepID=UPI00142E0D61|nr:ABC transporter ATP-binding protein [Salipiger sp. HF18]NIY95591.1 ABC transporter ATP-binding protein [Salipiger sp. HF18]